MRDKLPNLILLTLATLLLALSAWRSPVWYDDAGHYLVVHELALENKACYPEDLARGICDEHSPFITMGPALNYPMASWLQVAGISMAMARVLMVILSLEALLAFLALAANRVAPKKAFWALALVVGNVQLITYGSELLGEVPMLGWLFLGLVLVLRWLDKGEWLAGTAAAIAFGLAMLTKLYVAGPLALAMGSWVVAMLWQGRPAKAAGIVLMGLLAGGMLLGWQWWQSGSWEGLLDWLQDRGSYQSEFLAFGWGESLRFLLFKPLIWLGTIALVVKVRVKRDPADLFLLCFHAFHLLFFLASAGYDRFGFQLIFIPAIYLSEFAAAAWKRLRARNKGRVALLAAFLLIFVALFTQQTFPLLAQRTFSQSPNLAEKELPRLFSQLKIQQIFTYDQQIVPFLPEGVDLRLPRVVPSNASECKPLKLRQNEWLVAGEYARTEYGSCVPWQDLQAVDSTGNSEGRYVLWRQKR